MSTQQLVERLQHVASGGGGWVLWLMIALSIISLGVALERLFFFFSRRDDIETLTDKVRETLVRTHGDKEALRALLAKSKSSEASVLRNSLDWMDAGPAAFREVVDAELAREKYDLERGTLFLGTLGNNAPFVGLVGTVLGVIQSFQQLGNQSKESMGNVMVGIAEALIATGVGLCVAIPAVVVYNLVNGQIGRVESNVEILTKYILAYLKGENGVRATPYEPGVAEARKTSAVAETF
jgi:biopolymer transport protein ExbB/TolQ